MLPLAKNLKVLGRFQAGNEALEDGYKEAAQAAAVSDAAKRHRGINAHLPKGHFLYDTGTDHKCHTNEHNDYFSIVDKWYRTRYYTRRKNVKLTPIFVGHYMC